MKNFIAVTVFVAFIGQALSRSVCTDKYGKDFCTKSRHRCEDNLEIMKNCRKTCDTCQTVFDDDEEPAQDVVDNGGNTENPDCINQNGDHFCYGSRHLCDAEGMEELKVVCAKQCGGCDVASNPNPNSTPNPSVPCTNSWGDTLCRSMKYESCHEVEVRRNCRFTCNACNEDLPAPTPRPGTPAPQPATPTPSPAHDIPVEDIVACDEEYPNFCQTSTEWCDISDVADACPIACGLCTPDRK